jgi:hypothetical protein
MLIITLSCLAITAGQCIGNTNSIPNRETKTSTPTIPTLITVAQGLVDYWSFDEGAGDIVHDSVGGNNGQIYSCRWVTGHSGTALEFPSDYSYVVLPGSFDNRIKSFVSIDAWIYWYGHGSFPYSHIIFDTRRGGFSGGYVFFVWPDGTLRFYNDFKPEQHVISTTIIPTNVWTHVRVDFNEKTNKMQLFINNKLDASATTSYPLLSNDYGALIGNNVYYEPAPFNGIIDELKIYKSRPNPYSLFLMGRITNKTSDNSTITFNAKSLIVWDKNDSTFMKLKSGEQVVVFNDHKGFLGERFVIGKFNGYVAS